MSMSDTGVSPVSGQPEPSNVSADESSDPPGQVRLGGLVAQSMGATGVEINAFSVASVVTLFAGPLAPLAYLLASVAGFAYGRVIGRFARKLVSAGGTYQFIRMGLGGPAGIFGGSIYFMGLFVFVPFTGVLASSVFSEFMVSILGTDSWFAGGHWFELTVIQLLVAALITYRGIKLSARLLIWLVVFGFVVIAIFDVALLVTTDWASVSLSAFLPWNAPAISFANFALALGLAMGGFFASETAVFLGEEAHAPKHHIPRAVMFSIVGMMSLLVVNNFAILASIGPENSGEFAEQGAGITLTLAAGTLGTWYGQLLLLVIALACFTSVLALFNANARLLFDWGREGTLPAALGRVSTRNGNPGLAVLALLIASVVAAVIGLVLKGNSAEDGTTLFSWVLLAGALWILLGYVLVGLSAIVEQWREDRGKSVSNARLWLGYIAPAIVVAAMTLSIVSQITPFPAPPLNTAPMAALVWVAVSVVIAGVWTLRQSARTTSTVSTNSTVSTVSTDKGSHS